MPTTIEEYFGVIARARRRLATLGMAPTLRRGTRSIAAIEYLSAIGDTARPPLHLLWRLLEATGMRMGWLVEGDRLRKPQLSDGIRAAGLFREVLLAIEA